MKDGKEVKTYEVSFYAPGVNSKQRQCFRTQRAAENHARKVSVHNDDVSIKVVILIEGWS